MTEKFAKLFEYEDIGQVLVTKGENEEGYPCIAFQYKRGSISCKLEREFHDGLEPGSAESKADKDFEWLGKEMVYKIIKLWGGEAIEPIGQ